MIIAKIRAIPLLVVSILVANLSNNAFADTWYHTGNKTLDSVLNKYENTIVSQKDTTKIKQLSSESVQINSRNISDDLKDKLMQNQIYGATKANLSSDVSQVVADDTGRKAALKQLVDSFKKEQTKQYRLFLKTSLTQAELADTLSFFDSVTIKPISSTDDGKSVYEISFSYTGRLAKALQANLASGEIPSSLFENVEVIKPTVIKNLVSTGTYLSGESVANLWGMRTIGATDYQYGLAKDKKITVGVIDTGVNISHPDLSTNIGTGALGGYNFITSSTAVVDDHGHGSHVSGIIGATVNGKGVFWVDSNVTIVPLKVLNASGYGSSYAIVDAINYAANNGVKVLNLSLGGSGTPSNNIICNAITSAKNKGVVTVVAAGNENTNVSTVVPAGCSDAITVGAIDSTLTKASFSNYGDKVDVSAPGVNIYSTYLNGGYTTMNGTSMATPYVAGLTAAILSKNPSYTTDQIKAILKNSNNSLPVTSSVNIGRCISMSKVMTSLGVKNDTQIDAPNTGSGTTNTGSTNTGSTNTGVTNPVYTPQLTLSATLLRSNVYRVYASAYETGGTISSYAFLNGTTLLYSGALNTYEITIDKNTTLTVSAKDARWVNITKTIDLAYTAPAVTPVYTPQLSLSSTNLGNNTYRITASAYETGGTISSYAFLNGTTLLYSGATNTYVVSVIKNTTITVRAKDARWVSVSKTVDLVYTAPVPVYAPTLTVSATNIKDNTYRLYASAYETNGKIVSYSFLNGTTLLYSGALSTYDITIAKNTTITIIAKDARWVSVSKTISLTYKAPVVNIAPKLTLTSSSFSSTLTKVVLSASDSDGKIVNIDIYINGVKRYYAKPNTQSFLANLILNKDNSVIKVIITDDKNGTAEKSITLTK